MQRIAAYLLLCLALDPQLAAAAPEPLNFGLFPYLTPQRLVGALAPLRQHLERSSGQPLSVTSAPSYAVFLDRMRAGDFDLVFVAPHFARIMEREAGFRVLAMTRYRIYAHVAVPDGSGVRSLADLRGRRTAVPPRDSLVYLLAVELLRTHGLDAGRDIMLVEYDTNENSLAAAVRGETDAAISGNIVWQKLGAGQGMRSLTQTSSTPGFVLMAHPRVPAVVIESWRKAALDFGETPEGRENLSTTGYQAWISVDEAALRSVDPLLRHMRQ